MLAQTLVIRARGAENSGNLLLGSAQGQVQMHAGALLMPKQSALTQPALPRQEV